MAAQCYWARPRLPGLRIVCLLQDQRKVGISDQMEVDIGV